MKRNLLNTLKAGDKLTLKPDRAAAYNEENREVEFVELQKRFDYKVEWIIGRNKDGDIGHYKPSDFK